MPLIIKERIPYGGTGDGVHYIEQTLTEEQKAQARKNIGAADAAEVSKLSEDIATKANAIKEKASGEVIVVTDSDEAKPLELAIDGKSEQNQYSGNQLLDITKQVENASGSVVYNDDGSCTISNPTGSSITGYKQILTGLLPVGTYTLKVYEESVYFQTVPGDYSKYITKDSTHTFEYDGTSFLQLVASNINSKDSKTYKFMLNSGSTALPYEPFVGGKPSPSTEYKQDITNTGKYDEASGKYAVEVKDTRKNLLDCSGLVEKTVGGITYTPVYDENGLLEYIEANGTATSDSSYYGITSAIDNTFMDTILNGCPSGGSNNTYRLYCDYVDENGKWIESIDEYGNGVALSKTHSKVSFKIYIRNGQTANKLRFYPMVRPVGTDDTYEPYKETTATVLLDEPLRGLPVSSDGNYVDSNGQQYVADELNSVDKKRTSRINRLKLTPEQEWIYELTSTYGNHNFQIKKLPNKNYGSINKPYLYAFKSTHFSFLNEKYDSPDLKSPKAYVYDRELTISFPPNSDMNTLDKWKEFLANNDVYVEYILATPITEEIDIDLGELSMFYPTTILSNDCNANMEVTYVADTKAYIDKKFAELATAMV